MNITTTQTTISDFVSTMDIFANATGLQPPDGKGPKGPKEPNRAEVTEPPSHAANLEWKQSLGVASLIFLSLFILLSLLQIKIHKTCASSCRKKQFSNASGKILFALFLVSLAMFCIVSIVFTYFIFTIDSLSADQYALSLIFCMVPYRIGKLSMSLFFIFRLHFVFRVSALRIKVWIIAVLTVLSVIGCILGSVSGTIGPLKLIPWDKDAKGAHPALLMSYIALGITVLVDVIVIIYYVSRLMSVVIMQGEVSYVKAHQETPRPSATSQPPSSMTLMTPMETSAPLSASKIDNLHTPVPSGEEGGEEQDNEEEFEEVLRVEVNHKMVRTITKSTLLSLIGILTSFWLHLEMLVGAIQGVTDAVLHISVASVDGAVNIICMYLIFGFARPYYDLGCKWCHIGMSKRVMVVTEKALVRAKSNSARSPKQNNKNET
eukprot:411155_1